MNNALYYSSITLEKSTKILLHQFYPATDIWGQSKNSYVWIPASAGMVRSFYSDPKYYRNSQRGLPLRPYTFRHLRSGLRR